MRRLTQSISRIVRHNTSATDSKRLMASLPRLIGNARWDRAVVVVALRQPVLVRAIATATSPLFEKRSMKVPTMGDSITEVRCLGRCGVSFEIGSSNLTDLYVCV